MNVEKFAAEVLGQATERAIKAAASPVQKGLRRTLQHLTDAYRPFLFKTHARVESIRTFLRPTESVDLLAHYVPVDLRSGAQDVEVDELIDSLAQGGRFVVSALAGSGKSVLMRYIALSFFHAPRGRIPLFFELRSLNVDGSPSILTAIHEYYRGNSSIEFSDFEAALRSGYFVIILDGFDEISPEKRNEYEREIIRLARDFDNLPIVISGRHDERFNSWEDFTHFQLKSMTLSQARELIRKSNYENEVKEVFLERLTEDFFQKYQSFLENPLLAIMMMLTFEGYAEIPDSLHEFYRIAFDTLLRRHDAMKGQFLRESHSGCSTEQFKQIFASFCVLTYSKSAFSFDRDRAISYLGAAIKQQGADVKAEDLLTDLIESICLLQQEGFEVSFVHRSFQEYFCAVFVANSGSGFVKRYLDDTDSRSYDSVLPMLMGIAQQRVESEWSVDRVSELCDQFPVDVNESELNLHLAGYPRFEFILTERGAILIEVHRTKLARDIRILRSLYPDCEEQHFGDGEARAFDPNDWEKRITSELLELAESGHPDLTEFPDLLERARATKAGERLRLVFNADQTSKSFYKTVFETGFGNWIPFLNDVQEKQRARQSRSNAFLGEVFGPLDI
ncbi:NACHT domain-containing protein [Pontixanthobacter aestiaquae]|uniref:NACHT domain-containing protein n=1 Tax=Pontixanthobacter aestiaquae TaxID=1509367 RepID=A0A844Z922_9SPHN|nr:NACHT domain-containing protein [Pontixanthobacter aestiaquae]MDN3646616.1 NACHT domain-containing protein [Pontixanthobacter aestiaquae]MXO82399.1 NACHT domain-containing protein [Pontixanthobacter aestiaquae]